MLINIFYPIKGVNNTGEKYGFGNIKKQNYKLFRQY